MRDIVMIAWICGLLSVLDQPGPTLAGDWPQILGPHRNGEAENETLADAWPAGGPKTVWQRNVGSGFAGVAVADGTLVLFHRVGNDEVVEALDARSGKELWKARFPTRYLPSIVEDDGPRAVPLIHNGRVYVFGVQGGLHALDLKSGKVQWSRQTHQDYSAQEGYFGAGSTPIIEGDKIIVNVGGARDQAGIVAFALDTGKTVWTATDEQASYSSPTAATVDGVRHVIFVTRMKAVSLDPANGKVRFQFPFGKRGPTVNAATPLVIDGHLFLTASYGVGAVFAKIEKDGAKTLWAGDDVLSSQYTTSVFDGGVLYGVHGRQDLGAADLRAFDPKTQEVRWTKPDFGYATLIKADGKLLVLKTDGELVLAKLNPDKYAELARATVFDRTARALPALSNSYFYARDERTLKCIDLRK